MTHKEAIDQLRKEGFGVDDNPDLGDVLWSTSPYMRGESARLQERYHKLRNEHCLVDRLI